jgi:hypothetical protein
VDVAVALGALLSNFHGATEKNMGRKLFHPTWWNEYEHGGAWHRVKEAMRRDLEQTKNNFSLDAPDLNQDLRDTIKQATGAAPIPPPGRKTPPKSGEADTDRQQDTRQGRKNDNNGTLKPRPFDEIESPLSYGYAALMQYGSKYPYWDPTLEKTLRDEWTAGNPDEEWEEVAPFVRRGFEAPHGK